MKAKNFPFILIIFFLFYQRGQGATIIDSLHYEVKTLATFSGGENTPFWLVSNVYGLGSPQFNNGYVRGRIDKKLDDSKRLSWGASVDLVGSWNIPGAFRVQQLYAEIKYRKIWVMLGAKELESNYNNHYLSSGDLLFSGNSMPIPQLRLGTYDFAPFWGTKGWLSVKAYLSYGMFSDSKWIEHWVAPNTQFAKNVLFCSRGVWLRGGNMEKFPLTFDVGIEMGTQFGGSIIYPNGDILKMPTSIKDWIKAIVPFAGSSETIEDEQTNIQGNMNGEYSIAVNYKPSPNWKIKAYWEHYFEDQSQMTFEYGLWKDGLWGIEVDVPRNSFLSKVLFEYICTYDQTNAVLHNSTPEIPEQVSGQDAYFGHYLYGAWQNWGMVIGTPLAISPLYNRTRNIGLYNTRFKAYHVGLYGTPIPNLDWRLLLTFTRNWGTYFHPLPEIMNNFSGLIEINYDLPLVRGLFLKGALAWDRGKLLGNNFGGMISMGYQGDFSFKKK